MLLFSWYVSLEDNQRDWGGQAALVARHCLSPEAADNEETSLTEKGKKRCVDVGANPPHGEFSRTVWKAYASGAPGKVPLGGTNPES